MDKSGSHTPTPDSRVPNPDVQEATPDSRIPTPDVQEANPDSRLPNPESHVSSSESRIPSPEIAISVQNLTKIYKLYDSPTDRLKEALNPFRRKYHKDFYALNDVSFEVKKGEMLGIIGKNGSGKSTLLKTITGVLTPSSGLVTVNGKISALLELGAGFNPQLTGIENVYFNGTIQGYTTEEMDAKLDAILSFADIGDFVHQPVKTYSSGMFVRLAFAVAVNVEPDILIIDEALAVGDSIFQAKCYRRFQQFREKGITVILVTHNIGMVIQLCDRATVMHNGSLVACGMPKEMGDEYRRRCAEEASADKDLSIATTTLSQSAISSVHSEIWMPHSPNTQEYGDGLAVFEGFALLDTKGQLCTQIVSGEEITLRMKIRFNEACAAPIAAFGFRDLAGQEICGTNSWYENNDIGYVESGKIVTVDYRFELPLQAGVFNLCIACTEVGVDGLVVHHRLYDVAVIDVTTERRFTGIFDLMPSIKIYN